MPRKLPMVLCLATLMPSWAFAQSLPISWVDKDTGHRVIRLTDEPGSSGFYFNVNAFTPDGRQMVYNAPDGIHALRPCQPQNTARRTEPASACRTGFRRRQWPSYHRGG